MLPSQQELTPVPNEGTSVIHVVESNSGTSNEHLQDQTAQLQVVPNVTEIVEEMVQRAELDQAS